MKHYLLLGAGFSRNWGGWLAEEFFESLLGSPEVEAHPSLRPLLWKYRPNGFEAALDDLQRKTRGRESELAALQGAIKRMFAEMNRHFAGIVGFDAVTTREFLPRFDAIFSLNQDLLIELNYISTDSATLSDQRWAGTVMPGVSTSQPGAGVERSALVSTQWTADGELKLPKEHFQPFFKLHGSTNWRSTDGDDLLVMGGAKSAAIQASPVLRWYHEVFQAALLSEGARLMVIGYSFRDAHINAAINQAAKRGLKLYVIDPLGVDVVQPRRGEIAEQNPFETAFIGASRRPFREITGNDPIERAKVMRFFRDGD
jgi:hypothetical protein